MEKNEKLLDYVCSVIDLEDNKEYLKVSDIGRVLTYLLGTEKTITGQKVNEMLAFCSQFQVELPNDKFFKYYPTGKFELYEEVINEIEGYGIIKWHYSIIPKLLGLDFSRNVTENIQKMQNTFLYRNFLENIVDIGILEIELLKIGILEK